MLDIMYENNMMDMLRNEYGLKLNGWGKSMIVIDAIYYVFNY